MRVPLLNLLLVLSNLMLQFIHFPSLHLDQRLLRLTHIFTPMQLHPVFLGLSHGLLVPRLVLSQSFDLHSRFLNGQKEALYVFIVVMLND